MNSAHNINEVIIITGHTTQYILILLSTCWASLLSVVRFIFGLSLSSTIWNGLVITRYITITVNINIMAVNILHNGCEGPDGAYCAFLVNIIIPLRCCQYTPD